MLESENDKIVNECLQQGIKSHWIRTKPTETCAEGVEIKTDYEEVRKMFLESLIAKDVLIDGKNKRIKELEELYAGYGKAYLCNTCGTEKINEYSCKDCLEFRIKKYEEVIESAKKLQELIHYEPDMARGWIRVGVPMGERLQRAIYDLDDVLKKINI